jgi:hypothetical protein
VVCCDLRKNKKMATEEKRKRKIKGKSCVKMGETTEKRKLNGKG